MKNFAAVAEHFRKLRCAHCQSAFTPDGLKLLREEKDYWVVRVTCMACHEPSGVAVVGVEYDGVAPTAEAPVPVAPKRVGGIFASRKEADKFDTLAPINSDDVVDAHQFFQNLGSDWMRHLNRDKK